MAVQDSTQQISLAYVILFIVIGGTIVRFLFFGTPTPAAPAWTGASRNPLAVMRARDAAVERIQQMFPQVDRRTILWDLQRNGGNIQATSERILAGSIEEPPVTFQPPPAVGSGGRVSAAPVSAAPKQPEKPTQPDLITRYKLQDKLASSPADDGQDSDEKKQQDRVGKAWSSDRDERQASLQRRRDDMILQARRRMEAKIAAENKDKTASADETVG